LIDGWIDERRRWWIRNAAIAIAVLITFDMVDGFMDNVDGERKTMECQRNEEIAATDGARVPETEGGVERVCSRRGPHVAVMVKTLDPVKH